MQKKTPKKDFNDTGKTRNTFFPRGVIAMQVKKHSLFH